MAITWGCPIPTQTQVVPKATRDEVFAAASEDLLKNGPALGLKNTLKWFEIRYPNLNYRELREWEWDRDHAWMRRKRRRKAKAKK